MFISIILATGDDNTENEGQSPTKTTKGKPGRKAGQTKSTKNKDNDQEAENETGKINFVRFRLIHQITISATGDDDTAENEDASPSKKTKGKPGRKPAQKSKTTENKDNDQEMDNDFGNNELSFVLYIYSFR